MADQNVNKDALHEVQQSKETEEIQNDVIPCDFVEVGCQEKVARNMMSQHLKDAIVQHMSLIMKENREVKCEVHNLKQQLQRNEEKSNSTKEVFSAIVEKMQQQIIETKRDTEQKTGKALECVRTELKVLDIAVSLSNSMQIFDHIVSHNKEWQPTAVKIANNVYEDNGWLDDKEKVKPLFTELKNAMENEERSIHFSFQSKMCFTAMRLYHILKKRNHAYSWITDENVDNVRKQLCKLLLLDEDGEPTSEIPRVYQDFCKFYFNEESS